jgi:hypothetical protein
MQSHADILKHASAFGEPAFDTDSYFRNYSACCHQSATVMRREPDDSSHHVWDALVMVRNNVSATRKQGQY